MPRVAVWGHFIGSDLALTVEIWRLHRRESCLVHLLLHWRVERRHLALSVDGFLERLASADEEHESGGEAQHEDGPDDNAGDRSR